MTAPVRRAAFALLAAAALPAAAALGPARATAQETPPVERRLAVDYAVERFDADLDPWHLLSVEALRRAGWGAVLARGTLARRFGDTGEQLEVEAYPRLGGGTYAYLGAGWSPSGLFPRTRWGAELFATVARGLEASAGARYLAFEDEGVTLLTGSLGAYAGPYYLAVRPFLSPRDGELLASAGLLARRYLGAGEGDEWVALSLSGGEVPPEETTAFELERRRSARAALEGRMRLGDPLGVRWTGGYVWEELPGGRVRRRIVLGAGLEARF